MITKKSLFLLLSLNFLICPGILFPMNGETFQIDKKVDSQEPIINLCSLAEHSPIAAWQVLYDNHINFKVAFEFDQGTEGKILISNTALSYFDFEEPHRKLANLKEHTNSGAKAFVLGCIVATLGVMAVRFFKNDTWGSLLKNNWKRAIPTALGMGFAGFGVCGSLAGFMEFITHDSQMAEFQPLVNFVDRLNNRKKQSLITGNDPRHDTSDDNIGQ